jgi:26S proteasome regulatory subunit T1
VFRVLVCTRGYSPARRKLDGFDPRGNIKVLMATNRPDTLDPALMRPGRLDRKVEFGLPDLEVPFNYYYYEHERFTFTFKGRTHIFKIHARSMSVDRSIRFELLARLCPNSTGAECRSVCTEAGMFAIRARRKVNSHRNEKYNTGKFISVIGRLPPKKTF